jgi:hypothetical protein
MNSVVDGIGSLRTHAGTAHGHGKRSYRVQARHARLAIHASHTLVGFFLETWDERKRTGRPMKAFVPRVNAVQVHLDNYEELEI